MCTASRIVACVLLAGIGCATRLSRPPTSDAKVDEERALQQRLALSLFLERLTQVWSVGYDLRTSGADLCGENVHHAFGFLPLDRETFSEDSRAVAEEVGVGAGLRVWHVVPNSPASELEKGDRISAIDGKFVSDAASLVDAMQRPRETGTISLELLRESGAQDSISFRGIRACSFGVALVEGDSVNAFADGTNVLVTTGMLRFVESDDELALVVGHEISHNALGHLRQRKTQAFGGLLLDIAVGVLTGVDTGGVFSGLAGMAFSEAFEADADYMGTYLAARAGYDVEVAPDFWRRMAVEYPQGIEDSMMATHPSTPERSVALERCVEEIGEKQRAGAPLVPASD